MKDTVAWRCSPMPCPLQARYELRSGRISCVTRACDGVVKTEEECFQENRADHYASSGIGEEIARQLAAMAAT